MRPSGGEGMKIDWSIAHINGFCALSQSPWSGRTRRVTMQPSKNIINHRNEDIMTKREKERYEIQDKIPDTRQG